MSVGADIKIIGPCESNPGLGYTGFLDYEDAHRPHLTLYKFYPKSITLGYVW